MSNQIEGPIKILLAEDEETDCILIKHALTETEISFQIFRVKNGEEALDFLLHRQSFQDISKFPKPDLVLMDVFMPRKGGREVFEEMLQHPDLLEIPVIFLTSLATQEVALEVLKMGATDYINKANLSAEYLEKSIRYALELHSKEALRRQAEQLSERLGRILDNSMNEIYTFDAETLRFLHANRGARRNLGYSEEELQAISPLELMPELTEQGFLQQLGPLRNGEKGEIILETLQRRKNGSTYPVELRIQLSRSEVPPAFVAIAQDITERKQHEQAVHQMAYYDLLTHLPNRILLRDRIGQALAQARRSDQTPMVLCLGIDRFKNVIETLGHTIGDQLLRGVAHRLTTCLREGDTVARVGGDEFMMMISASGGDTKNVANVAQRVLRMFRQPFKIDNHILHITISMGISLYPYDGKEPETLIKNANIAMNRAKERGRNNYQLFTASMHARVFGQLLLENSFRKALERQELLLHYQPVIEAKQGKVVAVEALVRWNHPDMGLISPANFIPMAEETGLIVPMGEWVLRAASAQDVSWQQKGIGPMVICINISASQFIQKDFVATMEKILKDTGLPPSQLILELTESILMEKAEDTIETLQNLKKMNVKLSVDDFGVGYSSLSYLKKFPIDFLKIDRTFVHDIIDDPKDAAIVRSIISLAHNLKLNVIAEGVETKEQWAFLCREECDQGQGYLFSKPLPADQMAKLLSGENPSVKESRKVAEK